MLADNIHILKDLCNRGLFCFSLECVSRFFTGRKDNVNYKAQHNHYIGQIEDAGVNKDIIHSMLVKEAVNEVGEGAKEDEGNSEIIW